MSVVRQCIHMLLCRFFLFRLHIFTDYLYRLKSRQKQRLPVKTFNATSFIYTEDILQKWTLTLFSELSHIEMAVLKQNLRKARLPMSVADLFASTGLGSDCVEARSPLYDTIASITC